MIISIIIGFLLSLLNAVAGIVSARIAMKKDDDLFTQIVLGSMVIRYFVVALVVFLIIKYLSIDNLGFGLSFMISTFILIISEIFYLNNRLNFLNLHKKNE